MGNSRWWNDQSVILNGMDNFLLAPEGSEWRGFGEILNQTRDWRKYYSEHVEPIIL